MSSFDSVMYELFCSELKTQCRAFNQDLLEIEQHPEKQHLLVSLMRATHSIKGAARVVNLDPLVCLAHAMEDCMSHAQRSQTALTEEKINLLLQSSDILIALSQNPFEGFDNWWNKQLPSIELLIKQLSGESVTEEIVEHPPPIVEMQESSVSASSDYDRGVRIAAGNLNQLMNLSGESLIESHWLDPFKERLLSDKKQFAKIETLFEQLKNQLRVESCNLVAQNCLVDLHMQLNEVALRLGQRVAEMDEFNRHHASLSEHLYQNIIKSRMQPLAEGIEGFSRMVRDLSRKLNKEIRLEIEGQATLVDREILEKLEAPLNHLLRNAIDHGIELPQDRINAKKNKEGVLLISARHDKGMLEITVSDDGRGIDIERLKNKIIEKKMLGEQQALALTPEEAMDYLFLPGFSTASEITEVSGRGVGLDIVHSVVRELGGYVKIESNFGKGVRFILRLPLTRSVVQTLIVEIAGENYGFSLMHIEHALITSQVVDQTLLYGKEQIPLIDSWTLWKEHPPFRELPFCVVVLKNQENLYGLIVDKIVGEKELLVQPLDRRLKSHSRISSAALMEDGSPILIFDVKDLLKESETNLREKKKVLIIDDSKAFREREYQVLSEQGYDVDKAIDARDAWNALATSFYDLIITDIEMPGINGFELIRKIKKQPTLQNIPVMIVSSAGTERDKLKGNEVGAADYYVKDDLRDGTYLECVLKLLRG